jgi:hypothetical protein
MKAKEFIPASKPRNPVVRQQQTSGAGAHRDKKKEQKQGYEKHKGQNVAEVSKSTLDQYLTKASDSHGHADFAARQSKHDPDKRSYHVDQKKTAEKRRQGISRALDRMSKEGMAEGGMMKSIQRGLKGWQGSSHLTDIQDYIRNASDKTLLFLYKNPGESPYKQTPRDIQIKLINRELKRRYGVKPGEEGVAEGWGQREFEVNGYVYMTDIDEEEDNRKIFHMLKTPEGKTIDIDFTPYAYMTKNDVELYIKLGMPKRQGIGSLDSEKLQKMAQIKGVAMLDPKMARAGMSERIRDPEDWDEGDTEPPNNFAVYINGKKWKVFQGRGQFADDYKEMQHYRQLQNWAQAKSQATGKKWEVYKTGEAPTA